MSTHDKMTTVFGKHVWKGLAVTLTVACVAEHVARTHFTTVAPPSEWIHACSVCIGRWLEWVGYTLAQYTDLVYIFGGILREFATSCWAMFSALLGLIASPLRIAYGFWAYYGIFVVALLSDYSPSGSPLEAGILLTSLFILCMGELSQRIVGDAPERLPSHMVMQSLRATRRAIITIYEHPPDSNPEYSPSAPQTPDDPRSGNYGAYTYVPCTGHAQ